MATPNQPNKPQHALVIGGTGMMAEVSLWLARTGYRVTVICRNKDRADTLKRTAPPDTLCTHLVDYNDTTKLTQTLTSVRKSSGTADLVVAWIHSNPEAVLQQVEDHLVQGQPYRLVHVVGSSSNLDAIRATINTPPTCRYQQVQLGFILEDTHSRWLTHAEISSGVIKAIKTRDDVTVVGR
ncbi:short-chain dehydrogenase [Paenalkalicoccus suaedae]|uniref:Short-chain dehydrogenase n=1 Tax=Paenalkalicoccus suaedae TaxID=2592382 RepID=A0A859FJ62_9BACI|nr:short-chain dehydrogenase [Paenalkalicoccus suaedae]QKS72536.1 short-chain dehydrogenase [Paenalkalicoccus suaedae]